jgi:hypothetical protein
MKVNEGKKEPHDENFTLMYDIDTTLTMSNVSKWSLDQRQVT